MLSILVDQRWDHMASGFKSNLRFSRYVIFHSLKHGLCYLYRPQGTDCENFSLRGSNSFKPVTSGGRTPTCQGWLTKLIHRHGSRPLLVVHSVLLRHYNWKCWVNLNMEFEGGHNENKGRLNMHLSHRRWFRQWLMKDSSFYWPYVSICSACLSLVVTGGATASPAERNLDLHEEYYNSNHDAGMSWDRWYPQTLQH